MHRRKAILSFFLISGGAAASWSGYKWYRIHRTPDLEFLEKSRELIAALADVIIPTTDTPGASAAGVDAYIIAVLRDCADRKTQNNFIDGLKDVAVFSTDKYQRPFTALSQQEQQETVIHFREKGRPMAGMAGKVQNKFFGKSFYDILRSYTTAGYCSSKLGAQQALAYQYIPGNYQACIPLAPGQKAWATK